MFRYDCDAGAGPTHTASSAKRTWSASASASEWTATVLRLSMRQARMTRSAISPRLAISTLRIMERLSFGALPNTVAGRFDAAQAESELRGAGGVGQRLLLGDQPVAVQLHEALIE